MEIKDYNIYVDQIRAYENEIEQLKTNLKFGLNNMFVGKYIHSTNTEHTVEYFLYCKSVLRNLDNSLWFSGIGFGYKYIESKVGNEFHTMIRISNQEDKDGIEFRVDKESITHVEILSREEFEQGLHKMMDRAIYRTLPKEKEE